MDFERIKQAMLTKYGPLPLWGWSAIVLVGLIIWRYRQAALGQSEQEDSGAYDLAETEPSYYDYGPATGGSIGSSGGTAGGEEASGDGTIIVEKLIINKGKGNQLPKNSKNKKKSGKSKPTGKTGGKGGSRSSGRSSYGRGPASDIREKGFLPPIGSGKGMKDWDGTVSGKSKKKTKGENKLPENKKDSAGSHKKPQPPRHPGHTTIPVHGPDRPPSKNSIPENRKNGSHAGIPRRGPWETPGISGNPTPRHGVENKGKPKNEPPPSQRAPQPQAPPPTSNWGGKAPTIPQQQPRYTPPPARSGGGKKR